MTTQKAVRIHETGEKAADVTRIEQVEIPEINDNEFLVKNHFAGLNFIESYFRKGLYPCPKPMNHGREATGEIVKVGANVKKFQVGDKVAYMEAGCLREYYVLTEKNSVCKLPEGIDEKQASAGIIQGLTAYVMTTRAYQIKKGDIVMIHAAAGGTGALLVQFAKSFGATVIGTTSTKEKCEIAKEAGCDYVINYKEENTVEKVKEYTNGKGAIAIYDSVGKDTWDATMQCAAKRGTIVSFGNASGPVPPVSLLTLSPKCLTISRPTLMGFIDNAEEFEEYANKLFEFIKSGELKIRVSATYSLDQFVEAMDSLESGKTIGKLMFEI